MKNKCLKSLVFLIGRVYHNTMVTLSCFYVLTLETDMPTPSFFRVTSWHLFQTLMDKYHILADSKNGKGYNEIQYIHHFIHAFLTLISQGSITHEDVPCLWHWTRYTLISERCQNKFRCRDYKSIHDYATSTTSTSWNAQWLVVHYVLIAFPAHNSN